MGTTLVQAVQAAGLADTLSSGTDMTIFAPTNEAFAAVPNLDAILADTDLLSSILTYHILQGDPVSACDATNLVEDAGEDGSVPITTLTGGSGGLMIDNANIVVTDVCAANNVVVHV